MDPFREKRMRFGARLLTLNTGDSSVSCVLLGKLLNPSEPPFPCLTNADNTIYHVRRTRGHH